MDGVKPDIVISLDDATMLALASGKLNGQKAFMSGKLKIKVFACLFDVGRAI